LFQHQRCWNTATYGESKKEAIFPPAFGFLRGDAILEVDTSVKVF